MKTTLLSIFFALNSWIIFAQFGPQQIISSTTIDPHNLLTSDIDNDGDIDVFCVSGDDYKMRWFKNLNGEGDFSDEIIISENIAYYISIDFVDIDSDGDKDIIYLENNPKKIEWLENLDGQGNFGPVQVILENQQGVIYNFTAIDMDNDNDSDLVVLYSNSYTDWIVWYENLDGQGNFGGEVLLVENLTSANNPQIIDINNDGLLDILTSTETGGGPAKIIWLENLGDVTFGEEQVIHQFDFFQSDWTSVIYLDYVDINTDNKKDIVVVTFHGDFGIFRYWIENINNQGDFGTIHSLPIFSNFFNMDNDGDYDMLNNFPNSIIWNENTDGLGTFSTQHLVTNILIGKSTAANINNDELIDVVISSTEEDIVVWCQNGVLGIEDIKKNKTILYPNPTNGILHINAEQETVLVEVYNLVGQKIIETTSEVNLSKLATGIYIVKIYDDNGFSETYKISKE